MARLRNKRLIAVAAAAGIAAIAGGAAIAATSGGGSDPATDLAAALQKQGVQVTGDQIRQAQQDMLKARLDAEVAAGRLTQAQADAILKRAQQGPPAGGPGMRGPGFFRHGVRGPHAEALAAVAKLMDVTPAQLRAQLKPGTSLAEAAKAKGVSRDDVVAAIKKTLDAAQLPPGVTAQQMAERIADEECGPRGGGRFRHGPGGPGFGRGFGPPPDPGNGGSGNGGSGTTTTPQYGQEG